MDQAQEKEQQFVHEVYEEIASHFSSTRYKPWPIVEKYLKDQKSGSIGLDIGCGNGKYLGINQSLYIIGCDRSSQLVNIAGQKNHKSSVCVADGLNLPFAQARFDFCISIAVIHHFSTEERRIAAIETILECLEQHGTALIYVWALEQKNSRRGWDEGMDQDVFVPWVSQKKLNGSADSKVYQRYYHLYKQGELEANVVKAGGEVLSNGYEKDNWWAIIRGAKE